MNQETSAKIIRIAAYSFILFAIVWGLAPYQAINAPSRILLDLLDWPLGDAPVLMDRSSMWLSSIGAGLVMTISIMLLGIVAPALERGDKKTAKVTIWAFVAWYLVDSAGSIAAGVASNAAFNIVLLAAVLVPLMTVKFKNDPPSA